MLGAVIEVASGKKLRDYMKENIFDPLGMVDTVFHIEQSDKSRFAKQYHFVDSDETDTVKMQASSIHFEGGRVIDRGIENVDDIGAGYDSGGGGLISSVSDYSKLCASLASDEKILKRETVDLLRTNQLISPGLMKNFNWPQLKGYGYGLGVRTLIDESASGSNGSFGEFGWGGAAGATVLCDPDLKLSMFYAHHMLNPQESYYQPRLRNALYECLK